MTRLSAWLKKWWWTLAVGLAAIVGVLIYIFARTSKQQPPGESFSTKARAKIVEAETDAKIERLKADADSEVQQAKLEEISKIEDGVTRRVRLAQYLDGNL